MVGSRILFFLVGTRKHPKEATVTKRSITSGLKKPLQLETDETVFSSSSFSELNISDKLVILMIAV